MPAFSFAFSDVNPFIRLASWPGGRTHKCRKAVGEESPGSMETRCRLMAGGGDPRESATESKPPRFTVARVKGWGKSPPRDWQQERHGKPHREQDRIGAVRGETLEGCFRLTVRVGCVRRMATCAQDEWPPRSRAARGEGHTEPGLQASWQFSPTISKRNLLRSAGCAFGRAC